MFCEIVCVFKFIAVVVIKKVKGIEVFKVNENKCLVFLKYWCYNKVEVIKCKFNIVMIINIFWRIKCGFKNISFKFKVEFIWMKNKGIKNLKFILLSLWINFDL